ncbi:putative HNHc nuclease [Lacticaseibacillus nasuensis]|uniref:putative HNHc nuclease n=1 Tax=Lacticaseibacillus nasuensis TaxID=944671 RepID=UPI0006D1CC7E|nr:putative HNHc nuclease [Lacticaseibacillus nasuensis]
MRVSGKLTGISGRNLTLTVDDEVSLYEVAKLANGKQPSVDLQVEDGRSISPDQRRKIWALLRDISDFTGDVIDYTEDLLKGYTRQIFGIEAYSLSDCSMTTASNMIYTILEFCFRNDIPFKTRTWDMIPNDYARQWFCLRFKKCVICGKPADLAHFETVGMGRNRYAINELDYHWMSLCRVHHTEQHATGIDSFIAKYHIKPIKLDADQLRKIKPQYAKGVGK